MVLDLFVENLTKLTAEPCWVVTGLVGRAREQVKKIYKKKLLALRGRGRHTKSELHSVAGSAEHLESSSPGSWHDKVVANRAPNLARSMPSFLGF